jgi:hypothetical protein
MKKLILLFLLLSALHSARASDTLTVRQVYNFAVGDTFDYLETGYPGINSWRYIISSKYTSPTNDTITYMRFNPDTLSWHLSDTLLITKLDSTILVASDTPCPSCGCRKNFRVDSAFNTQRNVIQWDCVLVIGSYGYIAGLGRVWQRSENDDGNYDDIRLTYFSNGVQRIGYPLEIPGVEKDINIQLYPNPTLDLIHLSYSDGRGNSGTLFLTDLLGQQVYSSTITESETTHDISSLPSGIYTWRVVSDNTILKTGKIVKQ